jgi:exo-beta-1,3-glucanase (GH17 family)
MKTALISALALAATVSAHPSTLRHGHLHSTKRQDYGAGNANTNADWTDNAGYGLAYDLMADNGGCRQPAEIQSEIAQYAAAGVTLIRTYDVGCDNGALAAAIQSHPGMKLFAGINTVNNVASDLGKLVGMLSPYWAVVDTINIGNEQVNNGAASVDQVVAAIGQARGILGAAGYTGKVVTVDTFIALQNNPALCIASDYCAANTHAYFDPNTSPDQAGAFVKRMQAAVSAAAGGKKTVVTESGWPSCGGDASRTSESAQGSAIASLKGAFAADQGELVLFQDRNAVYKGQGVEACWGIYN